ncbi:MAG: hypothetical protein CM15mP25_4320 [Gammaproteobacteria bacterium]|nr:MAG: hypothetical protein CM15mP25_4320 [Gammaproteobacteria bacterium]
MGASFSRGDTDSRYPYGYGVPKSAEDGKPPMAIRSSRDQIDFRDAGLSPTRRWCSVASEMNFNDIWAISGIPVSPFDARDADVQVTAPAAWP